MMSIVYVIADIPSDLSGVEKTLAVCMGVVEMPSVCTGVVDMPPDFNRVAGTLPLTHNKWSGLMTTSVQETLELVGSILEIPFHTMSEKETLEVVGSILVSPFYKDAT